MLEGGAVAVSGDDDVTSNRAVRQMEERIRELERQLGRKTLEVEVLKDPRVAVTAADRLQSQTHPFTAPLVRPETIWR